MIIIAFIVLALITFGVPIALWSFVELGILLSWSFEDRKREILSNKLGAIHLFFYGYCVYIVYFLLSFTVLTCAWFLFFYGLDVFCRKFSIF